MNMYGGALAFTAICDVFFGSVAYTSILPSILIVSRRTTLQLHSTS
ncbi:OPT family small oligopeptide transporter protein [Puccinia sorghi]|uniref:OPT family small oligopeptide transporter protein n=1 Tax=Puccinia sorghi TaxID=27349 RepID=A0A0L6VID9_9BASI|nr:OPT family small oligopeptide transporter protein [Puccinia sorghi]